jgi:hypothetical protein
MTVAGAFAKTAGKFNRDVVYVFQLSRRENIADW